MDFIVYLDWFCFVGNSQHLTFVRVEFHFVVTFPGLECVEVSLQDGRVLVCSDGSIKEAIISEKSDVSVFR